jgi:ATP-dependent RNA helicase RhlB
MFDLGFISDIRYILRRLPAPDQRLNLLFSATLAQRVLELAYEHMNNPTLIRIEPDKMTVDRVRQVMYYPSNDEKPRLLVGLLKHMDPRRSMVFVNTRRAAEDVERILRGNGLNAEAISGDVPQRKRLRMLRDFHEGTLAVLIGTDVASRGLHIPDVSHVFNYDLPNDPISVPDIEAYIGRRLPVAPIPIERLADLAPSESRHKQRQRVHGDEPIPPRHGSKRPGGSHGGGGGGGGRGPGGGRNGRPRSGGHSPARPPQTTNAAPPAGEHAPQANAGAPDANKRPRRRRGGRGRGSAPGADTAATPPGNSGESTSG